MSFLFINGSYQSDISNPDALLEYITVDVDLFTLHLPKNFRQEAPIYFVHVNKDSKSQPLKKVIIADEGCEAIIVDTYQGRRDLEYFNDIEINVHVKENARLHYYKLQQESVLATHRARFNAEQTRDSYLGTYHVSKGSASSQDHFSYSLSGEGATCESIGFYETNKKQRLDIDSRIQHQSSHTNSRQLYKGLANDQSHATFNGVVMVDPDIKEICAHQRNNNVLLSSQARVDTRPILEIYSDDVRCSHGATVGQLDESALFYLRSRGVDELMAKTLLTAGFANEIFDVFPNRDIATMMRGESGAMQ